MVVDRPTMERYGSRYHDNDDAMSPRSMQSGLTKLGIETSHSAFEIDKQPPMSPLDKAKMQWKRHKSRIEAEAGAEGQPASTQPKQELRTEPSRSRSVSPERMPMYGDRARGDHRSFGLVGEPIEPVKLRPVPNSQRLVCLSKSDSRASRSSRSSRRSRSSRYMDARDDAGDRSRDGAADADQRESGCSNFIEDFAVRASQSFEDISKSFEEAEKKHRQAIDALSTEVRKSMPSPPAESSNANMTGTEKVTLASSFASGIEDSAKPAPVPSASAFPAMGSIFCGMDVLQGLCNTSQVETESTSTDISMDKVQEEVAGNNELPKVSTGNVLSCAGRCAAVDIIASENTFSLDGLAALSSDDEDGTNSQDDQLLILRETFSNLSSSLPEVGWKINVDANNRRLVQQRTNAVGHDLKRTADGTYKVVILDDRKGSSNPPIKVAVVERDPALLSRCHFAGWDGTRSHFTVLTPSPKPDTDAGSRVLQKLKEVPGTLTFTNPLSPSSEYSKMPRWMQPEVRSKCDGSDAVIHLVIGPEPPTKDEGDHSEPKPDTSEKNEDEQKMLSTIVSGWSALSFSEEDDDEDDGDDEEESYAPSTVGAVEDKLLRNFLGSADWYEEEETGYAVAVEHKPSEQIVSPPTSPIGEGGRPPLSPMPPSRPQVAHQRANTASSRTSTGSFHRRSNSIGVFTGDQLAQIVDPKLGYNSNSQGQSMTPNKKTRAGPVRPLSKKSEKSKFRPPLPIPGRLRKKNANNASAKKPKRAIWRKRSIAEVPSATSSSVGSSANKRSAEPTRRENSIIVKPSTSLEQGLVHSPQEFFIKCPMFRRALRSMGRCGKRERPRLEGWVAFSKGNILQTLGPNNRLCRGDFRYIVLTTRGGKPTLHIMTAKKDSNEASVDGVEHLVLRTNMKIISSDVSDGNRRCLSIVDIRNEKVIGTFMPVLINEDLFTDVSKSCLVSDRRFEKIMSGLESSEKSLTEEILPWSLDDGQLDAANHARFVLDCEMKKLKRK